MYSLRQLSEDDYSVLCEWWKWHRFPAPPQDCLPDNGKCGIMLMKDGVNICAGFLYFTNSKMCWLEFIISNPQYRQPDRKDAIRQLIEELGGLASRKGFKAVFTSVKNPSLIHHYQACGYSSSGNNTTEMVKIV